MAKKTLDRRTVLKGALATGATVSIPLPLLEIMLNGNGTALAQTASPIPPVFVMWFFGNGSLPGSWKPAKTGTGTNWDLSSQLMGLSALKPYLTVISGLSNNLVVGGAEHPTGSAGATTGAPLNGNAVTAKSIDQVVADLIATTPYTASAPAPSFRSLEVGVTPATPNGPQDSLATVSHTGPNAKNVPNYDPKSVFTRLFMGGAPTTGGGGTVDQATKLATVRKSVLDSVLTDGTNLQKKLGSADKQRVEQHLASIRAIEQRLMTTATPTTPGGGTTAACASAVAPTTGKDTNSEAPPAVATAMSDLSMLALACDKTRVLSYVFSLPAAHVYYRHLASNMNADFHDTICHGDAGDMTSQPRVDTGVQYVVKCLNEFLTKMQATTHGAGNLLDQALVYVTSDTAWGKIHTKTEWPVLLAGKAGGRLQGDGHYNFPGDNLSKAMLTVAQIMGSKATTFGSGAGAVTAPLSVGIK
jgi:hypothetical protein